MKHNPDASSISAASGVVRDLWEKHGVKQPFRFLGFCMSLLPVPVIQQVGQSIERHVSDVTLQAEMTRIWAEITKANQGLERLETVEESIKAIAETLKANPNLLQEAQRLTESLGRNQSEFKMLTEDRSYQELVNSIVDVDLAQIIAKTESTNVLRDSSIKAGSTLLHASGNSKNYVDNTTFQGKEGSVKMDGITTQGNIVVSESSVGFGPGGAIIFGNPNLVSANCPRCGARIEVDKTKLIGYSSIRCPKCFADLPFSVNGQR